MGSYQQNQLPVSAESESNTELWRAISVSWATCLDLTFASGVATLMDVVFPDPDLTKPVYKTALEVYSQAVLSVLLMDGTRQLFKPLYGKDELGGIAVPFFLFTQPKLRQKVDMISSRGMMALIAWMWPTESDGSESSESFHKNGAMMPEAGPNTNKSDAFRNTSPKGMNDYVGMTM